MLEQAVPSLQCRAHVLAAGCPLGTSVMARVCQHRLQDVLGHPETSALAAPSLQARFTEACTAQTPSQWFLLA